MPLHYNMNMSQMASLIFFKSVSAITKTLQVVCDDFHASTFTVLSCCFFLLSLFPVIHRYIGGLPCVVQCVLLNVVSILFHLSYSTQVCIYICMQYGDDSLSIQKNQVRTKGVCTPLKKFTVKYELGSTIKVSMIVKHFDFDDAMFSKNQLTTTSNSFFHIAQKMFTVPLPST